MRFLKGLRDVTGFLTIIPVRLDEKSLQNAASHMFLFPAVGAFIGLLAGCIAYLLLEVFPGIIVGAVAIFFILSLTGFYHIDGLLDFGDGLLFQGRPEEKISIMHDSRVGTGGLILGLLVILITLFCVSEISRNLVVQSLVASEVSAKLSMVILAFAGQSARKGINTYFVDVMHGRHRIPRLIAAAAISLAVGLLLLNIKFVYMMLAAVIVSLLILAISNVQFKGVTGDIFGAVNEVSRMTSLLTVLVII